MQIQKVQSNHPNFGTSVSIDSGLVKLWKDNPKYAEAYSEYINKLSKNGVFDVLNIRHRLSENSQDMVIANVYKIEHGNIYVGQEVKCSAIEKSDTDGNTKCANLEEIYQKCRETLKLLKAPLNQLPFK